jgi:UDP-glucose 4-epimerase
MKILLTGASSFVTRFLIKKLLGDKYKVFALSRKKKEISNNLLIKKHNLSKKALERKYWSGIKCVVHLANIDNNKETDPIKNLKMLKNLLVNMPSTVDKFIFISSQMIYGNPNKINIDENYKISPFFNNYSLSKYLCEQYLLFKKKIFKRNLIILRITGFIDSNNSLIFKIKKNMKINKNIALYNKGKTYRDYLFLDDLYIVIKKIISDKLSLKEQSYIFNLSSIQNYDLYNIANVIKKKFISKSNIKLSNAKEVRGNFSYNINLIKKKLNFIPKNIHNM